METKHHELKIEGKWYDRLITNAKTAELRKNDRDFQCGDVIYFTVDDQIGIRSQEWEVTHVLNSDVCEGLQHGYCVLSLSKLEHVETLTEEPQYNMAKLI